jgi:hypothetical protein
MWNKKDDCCLTNVLVECMDGVNWAVRVIGASLVSFVLCVWYVLFGRGQQGPPVSYNTVISTCQAAETRSDSTSIVDVNEVQCLRNTLARGHMDVRCSYFRHGPQYWLRARGGGVGGIRGACFSWLSILILCRLVHPAL